MCSDAAGSSEGLQAVLSGIRSWGWDIGFLSFYLKKFLVIILNSVL